MKTQNKLIVFFLTYMLCGVIYAQVYTPNGTFVESSTPSFNAADVENWEKQAANWLSARGWTNDVIKTAPATGAYNCHSYAWYKTEGGSDDYWINAFSDTDLFYFNIYNYYSTPPAPDNINKYWDDISYIEVQVPNNLTDKVQQFALSN